MDYEKLLADIPIPGNSPVETQPAAVNAATFPNSKTVPDPAAIFSTIYGVSDDTLSNLGPATAQARANRIPLPLNHSKYAGIAEAKGYPQGDDFSGSRLLRVHYSHEAMIDVIIAEPTITQNELAKRFNRSVSWISIVMGSDSFQAALAKRRDDIIDPFLIATVEERFRGLADQSLQIIAEKLEKSQNLDVAFKALEISSKALGFGARSAGPTNVQNNFVVALPAKSPDAAAWASQHSQTLTIESKT